MKEIVAVLENFTFHSDQHTENMVLGFGKKLL